jgi:hypothetical protein
MSDRIAFLLLPLLAGLWTSAARAIEPPRPFVTDGCTDFVNGTSEKPELWLHCCVAHDLYFWAGGTRAARDQADLDLRDCVRATGAKTAAELMYLGVRLGSHSPSKHKGMQWGNAWPDRPAYRRLTPEEIELIESELPRYDLPDMLRTKLIQDLRTLNL